MYKIETVENQRKCSLPLNNITSTLTYNQRIIISAPIDEPLTWRCTKVENTSPMGINRLTLAQDKFDQNKDYIEIDSDGNVIGMWADYFGTNIIPEDINNTIEEPNIQSIYNEVKYAGVKPQVKVGGSYKTVSVKFYKDDGTEIILDSYGDWKFEVGNNEIGYTDISKITTDSFEVKIDNNIAKIKCKDYDYLNYTILVTNTLDNISSSVELEIIGL